ncbi:MAG: hypothetical protein IJ685_02380, partial [Selenomonadaceae bacterium]|nr:hypothetical protein [Selenomonadaceae bacterium]
MSELTKIFSFDLQRFVTKYLKWDSVWKTATSADATEWTEFSSVSAGDTLILAEDATGVTSAITLDNACTLDLDGKTIESTTATGQVVKVTAASGTVTVRNGTINATNATGNDNADVGIIEVTNGATLNLGNENDSTTLTITGQVANPTTSNKYMDVVYVHNGSNNTGTGSLVVNTGTNVTTNRGNAVTFFSSGNFTINDGTINSTGRTQPIYFGGTGTIAIHGGTISYTDAAYGRYAISMSSAGNTAASQYTLIMDGGEIIAEEPSARPDGLSGGALEIGANAKSVSITGGTFTSSTTYGICAYSNATITGATVTGKSIGIVTHDSADKSNTVTIGDGTSVTGGDYGIYNRSNTKFIIQEGATVNGDTAGVYQTTLDSRKFGTVTIESGAKVGGTANVAVLNNGGANASGGGDPIITIGGTTITDAGLTTNSTDGIKVEVD